MATIESPGSINSFKEINGELRENELLDAYYFKLDEYRRSLAETAGITPEELHDRGPNLITTLLKEAGVE